MVWIPSVEYILTLFKDQIKECSLMNLQGLISTLDKVKWGIPSQSPPNIWNQVTILYKEIIEYHYFSDGNKRIGILLAYIFLYRNGYEFKPPKGEILKFTLEVAQGLKSFEVIQIWFQTNSINIKKNTL